ncbi:MAG: hypothetical protein KY462_11245 [Actinobacteria bacterium]|nr:hypothetical protein [Actinomycetota bacterium]
MSSRVNLLPREAEDRERARRARFLLVLAGIAFLVVLGLLYALQVARLNAARGELEAAEAERDELQAEVTELSAYAELDQRRTQTIELLTAVMAPETSLGGILQDVAAVMPTDSALTSLTVTIPQEALEQGPFDFGGPSFGTLAAAGETLRGHAPGVERLLLEFDKIAAFFNVFVTGSEIDEEGITVFTVESDLGPEIFTGRYVEGLPEELR